MVEKTDRITEKGARKIEERIAEMIWHSNDKHDQRFSQVFKDDCQRVASDILALISSVECGDCGGTGKSNTFRDGPKSGYYGDAMRPIECPTCKGTGYRKVMVRRECPNFQPRDYICSACIYPCENETCGSNYSFLTPFSPDDWNDIINKSATLELEVEG